jgi:hypothetical protein
LQNFINYEKAPPISDYPIWCNSIVLIKSLPDGEPDTSTILKKYIEGNDNYSSDNLPIFHYAAHSADGFRNLINEQLIRHARDGMRPLLCLDCHGSPDDELVFEDETEIGWFELGVLFTELNEATEFNLTLILSCCYGANFIESVEATKPELLTFRLIQVFKQRYFLRPSFLLRNKKRALGRVFL